MSEIARLRLTVSGIVQGVGFRPFLHRLANRLGLCGWVRNTAAGVELELEGSEDALQAFQRTLRDSPPPLAVIEEIRCEALDGTRGDTTFSILPSEAGEGATLVSPDLAPCPACLSELTDPEVPFLLYRHAETDGAGLLVGLASRFSARTSDRWSLLSFPR